MVLRSEKKLMEYKQEVASKQAELKQLQRSMTYAIIWLVVVAIAVIVIAVVTKYTWIMVLLLGDVYFVIRIVQKVRPQKALNDRIDWLKKEIATLDKHLRVGSSILVG